MGLFFLPTCQSPKVRQGLTCVCPSTPVCTGGKVKNSSTCQCECPSGRVWRLLLTCNPNYPGVYSCKCPAGFMGSGCTTSICSSPLVYQPQGHKQGCCGCPSNKEKVGNQCLTPCTSPKIRSGTSCVCPALPANARRTNSITCAWVCNTGYIKSGSQCLIQCTPPKVRSGNTCDCPTGKVARGNTCCNPLPANADWITTSLNSSHCWQCDPGYQLQSDNTCKECTLEDEDCDHGVNTTICQCNPAPSNLCGDPVTRTDWTTCHNGLQQKMQNTYTPCTGEDSLATPVLDDQGNPVTRSCTSSCPGNQVLKDGECKCRITGQTYRLPSACHTVQNYWCRCADDAMRASHHENEEHRICEPRCKNGAQFNSSNCTCYCTGANTHYNGTRCVTCSSPKTRWDSSTKSCKCPTLPANAYRISSTTCTWSCGTGYTKSGNSCVRSQSTQTVSCPPSGKPHLTRKSGNFCYCPSGQYEIGGSRCCSQQNCPSGQIRSAGSCACSPTPCSGELVRCNGACTVGKSCPGITEKVCPTANCPAPRNPQGLTLATPAECENEGEEDTTENTQE